MRNYISVLKLQLKNMFRRDRSKEKTSRAWIVALCALVVAYIAIAAFFIMMIYFMGSVFAMFGLQSEFIALVLMCGLMCVLIFGIVTVLTCLYFSRDTEFFLALPVKPTTVFAAKLTVVYLTELAVTALILLPCLIAAGIVMSMPAVFYVILPFAVILTPAIPLFLASIISIPVMYIVSFLRNRGAIGSIAVIILFGGFFALYYWGITKMQNFDPENMDLSGVRNIFVNIASTVYPLYALARAMTMTPCFGLGTAASVAVNLLICLGSIAAFGAVALIISAAVYRRGAAGQLESAKRNAAAKADYRSASVTKALMKKEWREVVRTPSFALNCLLGVVMGPIIVGFLGLMNKSSFMVADPETGEVSTALVSIFRYFMLWFVLFVSVGTDSGPATIFTREGEKFYYAKLLPVDCKTQIKAKSYVYMIINAFTCVLGITVMSIINFDAVFFACSLVFTLLYNFGFIHVSMWLDLCNPKLKWTTPNEAVKQNRNVMITVFVGMFAAAVCAFGGGAMQLVFSRMMSGMAASLLSWAVLLAVATAFAVVSYVMLYKNCEYRFEQIEA